MDRQTTLDQLEELLPLAAQWAAEQERRVLCEGVRLSEIELADAKAIGVRNPERVRLLRVDAVPIPVHPMLRAAAASINFLTAPPRGLALDYGIFIRSDPWRHRALIAHELVPTARVQTLAEILRCHPRETVEGRMGDWTRVATYGAVESQSKISIEVAHREPTQAPIDRLRITTAGKVGFRDCAPMSAPLKDRNYVISVLLRF